MKVLAIANAFGDGVSGVDVVVNSFSKELINRGHDVKILARTRTQKSGWLNVNGIPCYYVPTMVKRRSWSNIPYQAITYFKKINDAVKAFRKLDLKGDVLWLHYGTPDALWVGFKTFPNLRRVVHIHGVWTRDFLEQFRKEFAFTALGDMASKPLLFLEKNFLNNCDAIIVYSEWIKKLVRRRIREEKLVQIVSNPIDGSLFNPDVKPYSRKSLGYGSEDRIILYVGKLTPLKGTEDLLVSAQMLPKFKFLLVGRTVAMPDGHYEKMAPKNVFFHEPIPHALVPSFMKMCDCYVQPTLRDGLEIPIAEALAVGKPVVTTLHEERQEIYENAAYYAKPNSPKSLTSAIAEAWKNGPKNADKVLLKFDIKHNTSLIERMLVS